MLHSWSRNLYLFATGRLVFDLAFDGLIKVGATSHPSRLVHPADFEVGFVSFLTRLTESTHRIDHTEIRDDDQGPVVDQQLRGGRAVPERNPYRCG